MPGPASARAAVLALATVLLTASSALAGPVARTPGYKGSKAVPKVTRPAPAPPIKIAPSGRDPHVVVDAAGTAYFVWTAPEAGPGGEDGIGFCRLPRAATTCQATQTIIPQKTYDTYGETPSQNKEFGAGPGITLFGDQIAILSWRGAVWYDDPTSDVKSNQSTIMYVSDDGGTTFTGGVPVGKDMYGGRSTVTFGPPEARRVGTISNVVSFGTRFQSVRPGAYTPSYANLSAEGESTWDDGTLAPTPDGSVIAAFGDASNATRVRKWSGVGDPNDIGTWGPALPIDGFGPAIAVGPNGVPMLLTYDGAHRYNVRPINDAVTAAGAPVPLSLPEAYDGELAGTPGGYVAAFADRNATDRGFRVRRSADGVAWTPSETIAADPNEVASTAISAAPDGGGAAVWTSAIGGGEIRASFFGPRTKSSLPGLPTVAPGSADGVSLKCQEASFGGLTIATEFGCLLNGAGAAAQKKVAEGPLTLNGLRIVPLGDSKIVIDPKARTLDTSGPVQVELPIAGDSPIVLWRGELHQSLVAKNGERFLTLDTKQFPVRVKGFSVGGSLDAYVDGAGTRIPVALELPGGFGGARLEGTLLVDAKGGLKLDSLDVKIDELAIPPVVVQGLHISYTRVGNTWKGEGKVVLPGLGSAVTFAFEFNDGALKSASAVYDIRPTIQVVYPPIRWHQVGAGIQFSPLVISGSAQFGAIPIGALANSFSLPGAPTLPEYLVNASGHLTMSFKPAFKIRVDGNVALLGFELASAYFQYTAPFDLLFHGQIAIGDEDWAYLGATADLHISTGGLQGAFAGKACILGECGGGSVHVTNLGIGICALGQSLTQKLGDFLPDWEDGCDLKAIGIGGRRQVGGPATLQVPANARSLSINLRTASGTPDVVVVDPAGAVVPLAAPRVKAAVRAAGMAAAYVIDKPAAGAWKVVAREGSPPLTAIRASTPVAAPKLTATLAKRKDARGRRTVRYALTTTANQTVSFVERTKSAAATLPATKKTKGAFAFTPLALPAGKHTIVARIASPDGIVRHEVVVGSFTQPAPPAAKTPRRVTAKRAGARLKVTFAPAARNDDLRHLVTVAYADGRRRTVIVAAGKRAATFPGPRRLAGLGKTKVTVRALSLTDRQGPGRSVTVK